MARTDWTMNDTVMPEDMNQIGEEINQNAQGIQQLQQTVNAHLNDKLQDGVHGLATTQDMTLYVDGTNGDDSNDGLTPQTAFRTIQAAIISLPKMVNHTITINTTPGDYGECIISGFIGGGTIFLNGSTTLSSTHRVANLIINRCAIPVVVTGFEFVSQTKDGVSAVYAKYVFLDKCKCTGASEYPGFNFSASRGRVDNCELSNRSYGILSQFTSTVYSNNNSGSGNTYGLAALNASTIGKYGTQPSGTIAEYTQSGGVIR